MDLSRNLDFFKDFSSLREREREKKKKVRKKEKKSHLTETPILEGKKRPEQIISFC